MTNQCVLLGTIKAIGTNGVDLTVTRTNKNEEGIYETDNIGVFFTGDMMNNIRTYCHEGDIISVKGSLREDSIAHTVKVIAEKVCFLSSRNDED